MKQDKVKEKLDSLKMKSASENLYDTIEMASQKNWGLLDALDHLLSLELESKRQKRVIRIYKESRLTDKQTLDQFDFKFHKSRQNYKMTILNLMDLEFIRKKKNIILIGNTGVGKTYLAKCIAYAATQAGIKTLFTTATDMVNHLISAEADRSLLKKLHYYQTPDILVCDELGYLPLGYDGSNLFFQVISARHERKSTIITTNLPFAEWGKIFDSTTVATVIADRLVYNSEILIMEGKSYRSIKNKDNDN